MCFYPSLLIVCSFYLFSSPLSHFLQQWASHMREENWESARGKCWERKIIFVDWKVYDKKRIFAIVNFMVATFSPADIAKPHEVASYITSKVQSIKK